MRLTTRTNLAMRALMFCAVNPGRIVRKAEIAEACNASLNHLGLVINLLGQAGFIATTRGRNGGVQLARSPESITVGEICRLLESDVPFAECFAGADNNCPLAGCCRLRGAFCRALNAFYATLDKVTLAELTEDNTELCNLLAIGSAA
ncbi:MULTISPECIES: RrF2 family transcriptional regulator [unclassified Meridianimarinicoccus]|uniref:RrF2 family transcriptional regulator n=1 Tax=unclassified Meridianimarinicoccus TaxID=2923344 RepID=UPI0018686895|nr:Rrf2 family transcriptional regulator [Fluviibacterium sp. MJW13]